MIDKIRNTVINADCLDVLKGLPDKCVELVLTDPPYGINLAKNGFVGTGGTDFGRQDWDSEIPPRIYFDEMRRVSVNQVIFGGNYFVEHLSNSPCWIVWHKLNGGTTFADAELAWTSFKTSVRVIQYEWNGANQGDKVCPEKRVHPAQKPVPVLRWIIGKYSKPGDTILDPFFGSGSVGVACKQTGRNFIGIEKIPDYCRTAKERIELAESQMDITAYAEHSITIKAKQDRLF
jgi:site-specific DNA-methyltransferase (adenine-specific)